MTQVPQLRITTWPGGPVPVPEIEVNPDVRVRGERLHFGGDVSLPRVRRQPPDEIYLRELVDVDLADIEAVAALCREHGPIAPLRRTDLPAKVPGIWTRELVVHSMRYGRFYRPSDPEDYVGIEPHVDELTYRIRIVRQLAKHLQAHAFSESVAAAWLDCDSEHEAWSRFSAFTDAALSPFRVRVMVDVGNRDFNIGEPSPGLYSIAVLQMFNDLVNEVDYRTCAAEKCGRIFGRQRGRSNFYSRTDGVMYCTPACANSQAQREWRRRQRAKKRNGE